MTAPLNRTQLSGMPANDLCAAYVDSMCVTFKHDLDREDLARAVMRAVHEIFDRRELTRVFIHRDDVTGPEAVFCCDCMAPASPSCDSWQHGTVTLGELMAAYR